MSGPRSRHAGDGADATDTAVWVSFADLMTALMVLFLMLMVMAMMALARPTPAPRTDARTSASAASPPPPASAATSSAASAPEPHRASGPDARVIEALLRQVAQAVQATPGLTLDPRRQVIDFGDRARFQTGSHALDAASARLLREFVPRLLAVTESPAGQQAVGRVVVEGFADPRGDYLYNLNLSLQRGQRVICTLLEATADGSALTPEQAAAVRGLFAVGGFSFNEQRESLDASRRIELRVEFGPRAAPSGPAQGPAALTGPCRLPPAGGPTAAPAAAGSEINDAPERPANVQGGQSAVYETQPALARPLPRP
jgi:outer membrane protein OmpA-like peptidoglycan-associated protein